MAKYIFLVLALFGASVSAGWVTNQTFDELTDVGIYIARSSVKVGNRDYSIYIRCRAPKLDVYIDYETYLNKGSVKIKYRIDKLSLMEEEWGVSTDGTAAFAKEPQAFVRDIFSGKSLIVEAYDFRGTPYRAKFDLTDAARHINNVLDKCAVPLVGLAQSSEDIRRDVALDLDKWGPKNIENKKKILKEIGVYSGDVNSMMDLDFAKAVQRYYDEFINRCKAGFESSLMCTAFKPTWKNSGKILMPPVSIVIGDAGSDNLKKEADKMKISD